MEATKQTCEIIRDEVTGWLVRAIAVCGGLERIATRQRWVLYEAAKKRIPPDAADYGRRVRALAEMLDL